MPQHQSSTNCSLEILPACIDSNCTLPSTKQLRVALSPCQHCVSADDPVAVQCCQWCQCCDSITALPLFKLLTHALWCLMPAIVLPLSACEACVSSISQTCGTSLAVHASPRPFTACTLQKRNHDYGTLLASGENRPSRAPNLLISTHLSFPSLAPDLSQYTCLQAHTPCFWFGVERDCVRWIALAVFAGFCAAVDLVTSLYLIMGGDAVADDASQAKRR